MEASSTCSVDFPPGPITLPASATFISDADEEIFLLYTRLAALKPADSTDAGHFHGLGFENSKEDALVVRIELKPPSGRTHESSYRNSGNGGGTSRRNRGKGTSVSGTGGATIEEPELEPVVLEYELFQDKTALRSRSGDTGSVLWKTSIEFLSLVMRQLYFPEPVTCRLFDYSKLSQAHILELGAGTGLLGLGLGPLVRKYTATDMPSLIPLLRKNLLSRSSESTANVAITALEWTLPTLRQIDVCTDSPDVLLVVDCIYHPTLVRPLLATMTALAVPRHTVALVVAELRAEDVLREFLEGWIGLGWRVWSVADGFLGARWGMWVAWNEGQDSMAGGT